MAKVRNLRLITIVAQRKDEELVIGCMRDAGATGVTFHPASGTGVRQKFERVGRLIQIEKTVLLTTVPAETAPKIVKAVKDALGLDRPGNGFICVQRVEEAVGLL
ncbi:MAG: P-II family nitrogen regulator [Elusimicrobia bacterium]|nr:P-II family nitrogen regulator [Elusimicrobiota bacterium]